MGDKIVWVLGAGFSKPLGGPLLADLFTAASKGNLEARYPRDSFPRLQDQASALIRWIYRYGLGEKVTGAFGFVIEGERIWENAEEFLEYFDTAVSLGTDSPGWRRLAPIIERYEESLRVPGASNPTSFSKPGGREHLAATARRLMAAECSAFLPTPDKDSPAFERWTPYKAWWSRVQPGQTIITFNYDMVVERLDAQGDRKKLFVVPPSAVEPLAPLPTGMVPLIKLHGSLDWKCIKGTGVPDQYFTDQGDDFAVTCEDHELAIASPGLTKQRMVKDQFASLWKRAEEALVAADAIVFIGYRFPPTDSEALSRLLTATGKNDNLYLALHTVLGPKKSDDVVRLHSLLRYAARVRQREHTSVIGPDALKNQGVGGKRLYTLVSQALWSQDFLLIAQTHEVLQPYMIKWE